MEFFNKYFNACEDKELMSWFNIIGFFLSAIGALIMSVETFEYIFTDKKKLAKLEMRRRYAHFGPEKEQYDEEMADFEEEIWKRKAIQVINLFWICQDKRPMNFS